jgi:Terminase RNaseH-like domain
MSAPISPARRARAARELRQGGSNRQAAEAARTTVRTVNKWKLDPAFIDLLHGQGVFQSGALRIHADDASLLLDTEQTESALWIATGNGTPEVLGSLVVANATFCRAIFVPPEDVESTRAAIAKHRFPILDARSAILMQSALEVLTDPDELQTVCTLFNAPMRESFAEWCKLWRFRAGETKDIRTLEELWEGQSILADVLCEHDAVYAAKGRKVGETTLAICFSAYCARVRGANERIHLFSYRERAANALLAQIRFGLDNLPEHLRLPFSGAKEPTLKELTYDASGDDQRVIVSYPTSTSTAVDETASHSLLDELADWPQLEATMSSLEPTYSAEGSTSVLLTTGCPPGNYAALYYRACEGGEGGHFPIFIPATARPGRDAAWLAQKQRSMTKQAFRVEYALSVGDAFAGGSAFIFEAEDVEASNSKTLALEPGRKWYCNRHPAAWRTTNRYGTCPKCGNRVQPVPIIMGWDIGGASEGSDASVGTVLDLASDMVLIIEQRRFVGISFPMLQQEIEKMAREYAPAPVAVEMSGIGQSVAGNLGLPTSRVIPFWTTERSKARIIGNVVLALESGLLKFDHSQNPQLVKELLGYQQPDTYIVQDHIMSLAVSLGCAGEAYVRPGTVIGVFQV